MDGMRVRRAEAADAAEISLIENVCFPVDEAASYEGILFRISTANEYFYVIETATEPSTICGFINGTVASGDCMHHDSLTAHDPGGNSLNIHSVSILPEYRRQKLGSSFLREYILRMIYDFSYRAHGTMPSSLPLGEQLHPHNRKLDKMLLMSKQHLLGFYASCGFRIVGLSGVVHGQEQWFEMRLDMNPRRELQQYHVDAFVLTKMEGQSTAAATAAVPAAAPVPFTGNPAAVVLHQLDEESMKRIARENNQPVTAFVCQYNSGRNCYAMGSEDAAKGRAEGFDFSIRWFTPQGLELPLCGHATMASAFVLYHQAALVPLDCVIRFHVAGSGEVLEVSAAANKKLCLNFPALVSQAVAAASPQNAELLHNLIQGLHLQPIAGAASGASASADTASTYGIRYVGFVLPMGRCLVELTNAAFRHASIAAPDYSLLNQIGLGQVVITTAAGRGIGRLTATDNISSSSSSSIPEDASLDEHLQQKFGPHYTGCDFISRYFAPRIGIQEDAVTGSAHCMLAPYWSARFGLPPHSGGGDRDGGWLRGFQASARGGIVEVQFLGQGGGAASSRVTLRGDAAVVMTASYLVV